MPAPHPHAMPLPPDFYVAAALATALLLEWLAPLQLLPAFALTGPVTLVALAVALAGLGLELAAARALARRGTSTRPNAAPTALASNGVFAVTRNPFYCGLLLLVTGAFAAVGLDWVIVVVPALWLALDRLVVPFEERRLHAAFGPAFRDYASRTPRWL